MFRKFDAQKTIQAIGVVLRSHRCGMASKLRVLKILYIADRESIQENGFPIFGCRTVAMDHGPLHSTTENLIDGEHVDEPLLSAHIQRDGYVLQLTANDPGVQKMSRYEIEKIQEICERLASKGDFEIAHGITHKFDEWKSRYEPGTSRTIELEDIIEAVGRGADKEDILSDFKAECNADAAFGAKSLWAQQGENIPYQVSLIPQRAPTEREFQFADSLEPIAQQILARYGYA